MSSRYGWGWYDEQQWRGVETHHAAGKWLTLFTFEFIVLIALPPRPAPRVIKLSYTEPVFGYKRKWLPPRAAPLAVPATGVGHAGSYHLVVHSPTGLEITDGDLLPTAAAKDSTVSEYSYRRRIQPDAAQIYTTTPSTQPGQYDLRLGFIVPYKTLISPTITAGFAATVLTVAATKACQITTEVPSPAVVTLLFVLAPGLLALHLARPTEHPMLTQVLLPIRVLLLLILPTAYVTAYAAAFKYSDTWFWNAAYFSLGLFLAISLATVWTSWRAAKGRRGTGLTQNVRYHSEDDSLRVAKHGKRR